MKVGDNTLTSVGEQSVPMLAQMLSPTTSVSRSHPVAQTQSAYETLACTHGVAVNAPDPNATKTIYDFQVLNCRHELYDLCQHKGSVVLICNVASKCKYYTESGYTTLVNLYRKHYCEGFVVLAFPSNEFGNGEPGDEDEISESISCMYPHIGKVDFPIMAKVVMNGDHELPLVGFLKSRIRGALGQSAVRWNFTCFLVDQKGAPYARFAPGASIAEIDVRIEELLHPVPPPAPMPLLQAADPSAAVEAAVAEGSHRASGAVDMSSLDENATYMTPPSPGLRNPEFVTVSTTFTVTSLTAQGGPPVSEDSDEANRDPSPNQVSVSMLDATVATVEDEDLTGTSAPPEETAAESEQLQ
ncbi:glutathione peroxidase-like protein, putative [Leishmania panamensis]|uniref:Glutathione peroxidase n=2 Tax=Leishmania guyanensis species complex TaxID=38579 RepID=A0A088RSW2_LEIPA|nr:glutathione peroxidase-like protein, putative [Leishmania panamensis]AIN99192.1 glutathione peroxidase-like protein, putative [Leishmania panamensis]